MTKKRRHLSSYEGETPAVRLKHSFLMVQPQSNQLRFPLESSMVHDNSSILSIQPGTKATDELRFERPHFPIAFDEVVASGKTGR